MNYEEARAMCKLIDDDADLVWIQSPEEQQFINDTFVEAYVFFNP